MALPALADIDALEAWVDEDIAPDDPRALAVLAAASALVRTECGRTWVDAVTNVLESVPDTIVAVVVQVAARVWRNPDGAIHDVTGPFSARFSERVADGLYLTATEKKVCARHRKQAAGMWVESTTRGTPWDDTFWVPVEGGGGPFPW